MSAPHQIVVAKSELTRAESIATPLELEGFSVVVATTQSALDEALKKMPHALVILARSFGAPSANVVLKRIVQREPSMRPAVMVIDDADGDDLARVLAFELGADDYLVEPISQRELALRARAILRRLNAARRREPRLTVTAGPFEIDRGRHELRVDGRSVAVTPLELRLLAYFAANQGAVARRAQLLEAVWQRPPDSVSRVVDTTIKRLRQKLGAAGAWIETVRGVGYRLRDSAPRASVHSLAS